MGLARAELPGDLVFPAARLSSQPRQRTIHTRALPYRRVQRREAEDGGAAFSRCPSTGGGGVPSTLELGEVRMGAYGSSASCSPARSEWRGRSTPGVTMRPRRQGENVCAHIIAKAGLLLRAWYKCQKHSPCSKQTMIVILMIRDTRISGLTAAYMQGHFHCVDLQRHNCHVCI